MTISYLSNWKTITDDYGRDKVIDIYIKYYIGEITMKLLDKYMHTDVVTFASKPVVGEYQGYKYDNTYLSVLRWGDDYRIKAKSVKVKTLFCADVVAALATHEACVVSMTYDRFGNITGVYVVESFNLSDSSKETK